jgi:HEAT repeat protein
MRLVVVLLALSLPGCSAGDQTGALVKSVIDDLASQRYGRATARYSRDESDILSPAATRAWRRGLDHQDATVREWSVDALARIGDPEDLPRIVSALDDPFRRVQETAARGIAEMDPVAARMAFTERLMSGGPMQQMLSAQGLGDLGDPIGVDALLAQVGNSDIEEAVRNVIVQSLATVADPRAIVPLATIAANTANGVQLRRNAADALSTFEQEAATLALLALLDSGDSYVEEVARRAIAARR